MRFGLLIVVHTAVAFLACSVRYAHAEPDRATTLPAALAAKMEELHAVQEDAASQLLAVPEEDVRKYENFLKQPDTGIIMLLPRDRYDHVLHIHGGGAYYSFIRKTHEYGYGNDIELSNGRFTVGFAGGDYGYFLPLGDVPAEELAKLGKEAPKWAKGSARERWDEAWESVPIGDRNAMHERSNQFWIRSQLQGQRGRLEERAARADAAQSYLLRSISPDRSDVLAAIRVERKLEDGSVVLVWKLLKSNTVPAWSQQLEKNGPPAEPLRTTKGRSPELKKQLSKLVEIQSEVERTLLDPPAEDVKKYEALLRQPNTGIIKLLPRGMYESFLRVNGGGCYYSFLLKTHAYGNGSDLELQNGELSVGFAGGEYGYFLPLGNVAMDAIAGASEKVPAWAQGDVAAQWHEMWDEKPIDDREVRAREMQRMEKQSEWMMQEARRTGKFPENKRPGFGEPADAGASYLLRSLSSDDYDVMVGFQIERELDDGSIVLVYKVFKTSVTPRYQKRIDEIRARGEAQ